jgi:hypothetical protein
LLPSVQIFFDPFCFNRSRTHTAAAFGVQRSAAQGKRVGGSALGRIGVRRSALWRVFGIRTKPPQDPYLRFLCYLLFKFSSLPFVSSSRTHAAAAFGVWRSAFGSP